MSSASANPSGNTSYFVTGGTLRPDAASYVERSADRRLLEALRTGEFTYVLTSRQMGKSSMMVRTAARLREQGIGVVVLDLTALGQNLNPDQWYDGLLLNAGRQLRLEDELEDFWRKNSRLGPVQRWFTALRDVALRPGTGTTVIFIDEIDSVRSLPFATDEFFAAIRECYNRRSEDPAWNRLTFCLLGVATPADLIRDPQTTPFNIGRRIELADFTPEEAAPLAAGLSAAQLEAQAAEAALHRILHWTHGHPYLTQRLLRAIAEDSARLRDQPALRVESAIDQTCEQLFLGPRAREQDDNLLFVRECLLRAETDLINLLSLYEQIHAGAAVQDENDNDLIDHLHLSGIVRTDEQKLLLVRNRIYHTVYDRDWIAGNKPDAELEKANGERLRLKGTCSIGRAPANTIVLVDDRISRRHALIQAQKQHEFWLVDLGSSNGTFLNGRRISQPIILRDHDQIRIGQFALTFHQPHAGRRRQSEHSTLSDKTLFE